MPYIGNTIRAADDYRLIDDISSGFNGSETSFALQVAGSAPVPFPKSPQQVLISVNGVIQEPDPTGSSGFNLVGTNIVFSSAPTNGHAFFGIIYATADYLNAGGNFPAGSLGAPSITFIGDENTGLFRKSGGSVGFVSDATEIANFDSNGITISSGNIIIPDSIIHNGDTNTKIRFPDADVVSVETAGSERARIDSDGRLLINSTLSSPGTANVIIDTQLGSGSGIRMIGKSANDGSEIDFYADNNSTRLGFIEYNNSITKFVSETNVPLSIYTNGASDSNKRLTILSDGKVGIGTASPQRDLHVLNSSGDALVRITSADGNAAYLELGDASDGDAGRIVYDNGDNLTFSTANSGSTTEKLRIQGNGNVGIGTTSPGHLLEIKSSAQNANDVLTQIESVAVSSGESKTSLELHKGTGYGAQLSGYISQGVGSGFILSTLNGGTATERMRIDSAGNVGIGATTIANDSGHSKLAISGQSGTAAGILTFQDTANNEDGAIFSDDGNLFIIADRDNTTSSSSIRFRVDGSSEKMRIDSSGNVGIGTTSPDTPLTVSRATTGNVLKGLSTNNNTRSRIELGGKDSSGNLVTLMLGGDGDFGGMVFTHTNHKLGFATNNAAPQMVLDTSGNVGLGVTSVSNARFRIKGANNTTTAFNDGLMVTSNNGSVIKKYSWMGIETQGGINFSEITGGVGETMRINSNGVLIIHGTTESTDPNQPHYLQVGQGSNYFLVEHNESQDVARVRLKVDTTSPRSQINLNNPNGTVGSIITDGSSTSYNTSSDYRLKENAVAISDGIARLKTLKPYRFNFKADATTTVDGFFAHEVTAVPEAITGEKDAVDSEGKIDPQGIDQSKLVPLLTAALQEAVSKIETLETKVAALEAA